MGETAEARLKRLAMRSWRRGTKEMDLVFGPWADGWLSGAGEGDLAAYELLLEENDQDLAAWITGQAETPSEHRPLLDRIRDHALRRLAKD